MVKVKWFKEGNRKNDKVATIIDWELCKKYAVVVKEKWHDHKVKKVIETDEIKILWNMQIQTDKVIENSRPNIVVFNKIMRKCVSIDIACLFDTHINEKEQNKIEIYGDLRNEIKRIWKYRVVVIAPVIVGALGIISKFEKWMEKLEISVQIPLLQKACLLGTGKILKKVLDT